MFLINIWLISSLELSGNCLKLNDNNKNDASVILASSMV